MEAIRLNTNHLLLRQFSPADVDDIFAHASHMDWAPCLPAMPVPYTRSQAEEFLEHYLAFWPTGLQFALPLAETVVGGLSFSRTACPLRRRTCVASGVTTV